MEVEGAFSTGGVRSGGAVEELGEMETGLGCVKDSGQHRRLWFTAS